jgi:hypothetical protein
VPIPSHLVTRVTIPILRLAAFLVMIATVAALWNFMLWLPWQLDCALATAAAFAFAYRFEREESQ